MEQNQCYVDGMYKIKIITVSNSDADGVQIRINLRKTKIYPMQNSYPQEDC